MYIPPQEFRRLRYLSYGGYFGRPLLNVILPHLPVLDVLELVDLHLIEELGWLAEIPMLRVFILSNSSYRDRGSVLSLEEREAYFPQLFESCTNLQHIDINTEGRAYQRWFRDGSAPSDIPDVDDVLLPEWHIS
ncbi:hypothetical protein M413DRAFT_33072 [Hebeloma cylindrosporum]|uniref:F-box domain-containing protein n=1 Tax=Hebeloma cylindrosporum TaxID=76867 RepID=A0A0C3BRP3_HEBCY|nr:hypothetical protein M413DRAFT_33072 [Hebeloma cylindrosporum h7]